jgi:hypothetical protein
MMESPRNTASSKYSSPAGSCSGGKGGGVGVRIWCDHNQWFPKNRLTGSTGWIHQEFYFTAGEKSANFDSQFTIYLWNATGSVDYADLRIEPCE